jgi:hypothetical protein
VAAQAARPHHTARRTGEDHPQTASGKTQKYKLREMGARLAAVALRTLHLQEVEPVGRSL